MFLLTFLHDFCRQLLMPKALAYGDEILTCRLCHKAQIGCSFHSNRSRGFRAARLHRPTTNLHSTHSLHSTHTTTAQKRLGLIRLDYRRLKYTSQMKARCLRFIASAPTSAGDVAKLDDDDSLVEDHRPVVVRSAHPHSTPYCWGRKFEKIKLG
jgi:hypothetical protein